MSTNNYGTGDSSYRAAGEQEGIRKLVDAFYDHMERLPEARIIRNMHPNDLTESRQKLTFFLSGWLGGPRLFAERYGSINIPAAHRQFPIDTDERDAWLHCMAHALTEQPYQPDFKEYLLKQLGIPAERIRQASLAQQKP